MRKLAATVAACILATETTHATDHSTFECGAIKVVPAERNNADLVHKTQVTLAFQGNKIFGFDVSHFTVGGTKYDRKDQYRDIRMWSASNHLDQWSGVSIKSPNVTMVGAFQWAPAGKRSTYVEKIYRGGKLETTISSVCHEIDEEPG